MNSMIQVHVIEKSGHGFTSSATSFDNDNIAYVKEVISFDNGDTHAEVHLKSGEILRVRETKAQIDAQREPNSPPNPHQDSTFINETL